MAMSRFFGAVRQNGYVVRDIVTAMDYWINEVGVGPWFWREKIVIANLRYNGAEHSVELGIALANSGDLQIELIQPRDRAPSMFQTFLDNGGEGLQHIAYWTNEYDAQLAAALALGRRIGQNGGGGAVGRFAYFDAISHRGTVIELSELTPSKAASFAKIREASMEWDGTDPIRHVG
jgi:hypothetical protein